MKLSSLREKIWIKKEREDAFFLGIMLAAISASFATSYWHYMDRTELRPKIKLHSNLSREKRYKILREADYLAPNLRKNATFYKVEEYVKPAMPEPAIPDVGAQ